MRVRARAVLFSRALLLALPHGRETDVELRSLNFLQLSKHGSARVVAIQQQIQSSGVLLARARARRNGPRGGQSR